MVKATTRHLPFHEGLARARAMHREGLASRQWHRLPATHRAREAARLSLSGHRHLTAIERLNETELQFPTAALTLEPPVEIQR